MRGAPIFFALLGLAILVTAWRAPSRRPQPDLAVAYGADPAQRALLWRPAGAGPFPVAVLIHGGCWRTGADNIGSVAGLADDLRRRGIAAWDIDYRGIDRPGGGYPGTFEDVGLAIDALRGEGVRRNLDLQRIAFVGHSAGGHFALWAAARDRLPATSRLFRSDPLLPRIAVSLAGVADPRRFGGIAGACGAAEVDRLVGPSTPTRPDRFADTAPLPPAAPRTILLVDGDRDSLVPASQAAAYAATVPGDRVEHLTIAGADHVAPLDPRGAAWASAVHRIDAALR